MKAPKFAETGQVLILLSVGLVALLGFTALAIDGGAIFFDRRSAQNAADAAALAGAYELAYDPWDTSSLAYRVECMGKQRAQDNQYGTVSCDVTADPLPAITDDGVVTVIYPLDDGAGNIPARFHLVDGDTDPSHYVLVTITSTVKTSLIHFVFPGTVKNTVEAVAHILPTKPGNPFAGSGLVSLAPHACGRLTIGGNVVANLIGGGIFVNSDDSSCAADGGSEAFFLYTPTMNVVGGIDSKLTGSSGLIINPGPPQSPAPQLAIAYPPVSLGIPSVAAANCSPLPAASTKDVAPAVIDGITYDVWNPGTMNGFPNGNIYFKSGIYCVTVNKKTNINNNQHLYNGQISGDPDTGGVLIILTGTQPCDVTVNGGATLKLTAYTAEPYSGLLIYVDPRTWAPATSGIGEGPLIFNGTQESYIRGTVYAPTCSVKMNGTGGNFYQGQMIGFDVTMLGGAAINMLFVDDDNFKPPLPAKLDLNQ